MELEQTDEITVRFPGGGGFVGELPSGAYNAVLLDIQHMTAEDKYRAGRTRDVLKWVFAIEGREDDGVLYWFTSTSMHEMSKLPGTLDALEIPRPTMADPTLGPRDVLVGKTCRIMVQNVASATVPGRTFPRITGVFVK
jgi:hypothetical protein